MTDAHLEQNDTATAADPSAPEVLAVFSADERAAVTEHAAELKIPLADYVQRSAVKRAQEWHYKRQFLQDLAARRGQGVQDFVASGVLIDDGAELQPRHAGTQPLLGSGLDCRLVDELAVRTHEDGIGALAAAALIEDDNRFLLVEVPLAHRSDALTCWDLPTGRVRAGETVVQGLGRTLAEHYGYESVQVDCYLGHADRSHKDGCDVRVFMFAVTPSELDCICRSARMGHRWADSRTLARTLTDGMDDLLRAYLHDDLE